MRMFSSDAGVEKYRFHGSMQEQKPILTANSGRGFSFCNAGIRKMCLVKNGATAVLFSWTCAFFHAKKAGEKPHRAKKCRQEGISCDTEQKAFLREKLCTGVFSRKQPGYVFLY